jgi:FAD/FMN-containing dehydrogenase
MRGDTIIMASSTRFVPDPAFSSLLSALRGRAVQPGDDGYEPARRVYNAMIDRRPRCIVHVADVADVIECVRFASKHKLPLAVRGGAHSVPGFGTCDDGIVIDLSGMKGIRVDPGRRLAHVEGGCTWGDVDHATHPFALATPGGLISTTGVGGLTLGGGFGHLSRGFGLVCDNLISAEVVTADGSLLTAGRDENPDLFWALRGGGGNFGVVVSFEFKLHPVRNIHAAMVFYPVESAAHCMRAYRELMASAPRVLSAFFAFLMVPPAPPFPEPLHLKTVCGIMAVCSDPGQGEALATPLLDISKPVFAHLGVAPYPAVQSMFDALVPPGLQHYWKADFVHDLRDEAIAAHVKFGPQVPTVNSVVHIYPLDGAIHDTPADATAFAYRDVKFTHILGAIGPDPKAMPSYRDWVRSYYDALHPYSAGGAYVNFLGDEGDERIAASYSGNLTRLRTVKRLYDPENLFHINQNIKPAAS